MSREEIKEKREEIRKLFALAKSNHFCSLFAFILSLINIAVNFDDGMFIEQKELKYERI